MYIKQIQGYTVFLQQILGRGSFGNVYKGLNQQTKQPVAVKILARDLIDSDEYLKNSLKNQIKILQSVQNPHVVGFYDVMESSKNYYIIQQLCDGDLAQIIKHGQKLPQDFCIQILTDICKGFLALVREGIIHRDLKPANIFRRGKEFKIGDFGFSKQLNFHQNHQNQKQKTGEMKMKTAVGTPLYMSVQILKSLQYTSKCDIWALGFIFYEMLHGETPWTAARQFELVNNIQKLPLEIKRTDLSPYTVDFLQKCLQVYQKDRISWNQIFVHPIFGSTFLNEADQNKQFENKMKGIMVKLRFHFHLNRQNLDNYLSKYGYKSKNQQLDFQNYFQFLKAVNPHITEDEATYIYKKTDIDKNGTISLDQILSMLKNYGISIEEPALMKVHSHNQNSYEKIEEKKKAQMKIQQCFIKLNKIIVKNNLTLNRIFNQFDKAKKGYLFFDEFKNMLQKLSKDINEQEAFLAFKMMDDDDSKSLEFDQFYKHFKQINGIEGESTK